jgi:hypothetical protein
MSSTVLKTDIWNGLRWLYRAVNPIPKSPIANNEVHLRDLELVPPQALTRKFVRALRLVKSLSRGNIGDYVEFGVFNGTSIACMYEALKITKLTQVRLIGFDSFAGLPPEVVHDDGGVWSAGQFACPKHVTIENLRSKAVDLNRLELVEGWYKDTLSQTPDNYRIRSASVAMIDCDAYSSAKLALNFLSTCLASVAIIFLDDWRLNNLDLKGMGEFRAFREFLLEHPEYSVHRLSSYNRKSEMFLLRRIDGGK